jgi:hypothetical protein
MFRFDDSRDDLGSINSNINQHTIFTWLDFISKFNPGGMNKLRQNTLITNSPLTNFPLILGLRLFVSCIKNIF